MTESKQTTGSDQAHTAEGAPTDKAHKDAGDGTLVGSAPAGLSPDEMEQAADDAGSAEPGTG